MTAPTRKACRKHLTTLLSAGVSTAQEVIPYQKAELSGVSPVVMCVSAGSDRQPARAFHDSFFLGIMVFVLHSDPESGWTEEDAEDALDDIEAEITAVIQANAREENYWESLEHDGTSAVDRINISGEFYLYEAHSVHVEVTHQ
jgi:hypothetical protein